MNFELTDPKHIELLTEITSKLGGDNLNDGLQYIVNCWLVSNPPAGITASQAQELSTIDAEIEDDVEELDLSGELTETQIRDIKRWLKRQGLDTL